MVLFGEWKLLLGFIAILVSALIGNMILGYLIQDLQDNLSHIQMVFGMHLEWRLQDLAVSFLEAARFVSWFWLVKETQTPPSQYLV